MGTDLLNVSSTCEYETLFTASCDCSCFSRFREVLEEMPNQYNSLDTPKTKALMRCAYSIDFSTVMSIVYGLFFHLADSQVA